MVKRRPAIVLSPPLPGRKDLCTIVPLSTSEPRRPAPYHMSIALEPPLPAPYAAPVMWAKADIVLTVAFHRLRLLHRRSGSGERVYDVRVLDTPTLDALRDCVRHGLGLLP